MKIIFRNFIRLYRSEPLILFLLSWLLLSGSTLSTYAALVFVPMVVFRKEIHRGADSMLSLITLYSCLYAVFCFYNGYYDNAKGFVVFQSLMPPAFYLLGKWMAYSKSDNVMMIFLLILVGFIAIPVIADVVSDIQHNQFVNISRKLEQSDASATNMGIRVSLAVSSIGVLFGKKSNKYESIVSILYFIVSLLGIICVLHLVNRTGIVVAITSVLMVFLFNARFLPKKTILVMFVIVLVGVVYVIPQMQYDSILNEAYVMRNEGDSSVISAGGRTDLWLWGVRCLFEHPLGIKITSVTQYAHNYWLDTSIRGGIFACVFLVILTIIHIRNTWYLIKNMSPGLLRTLVITTNVGFFLTGLTEPIMEGFQVYVFLFFMFMGISQQYKIIYAFDK